MGNKSSKGIDKLTGDIADSDRDIWFPTGKSAKFETFLSKIRGSDSKASAKNPSRPASQKLSQPQQDLEPAYTKPASRGSGSAPPKPEHRSAPNSVKAPKQELPVAPPVNLQDKQVTASSANSERGIQSATLSSGHPQRQPPVPPVPGRVVPAERGAAAPAGTLMDISNAATTSTPAAFGPLSPQEPPVRMSSSDAQQREKKAKRPPPVEPLNLPPRGAVGVIGPGWVPANVPPKGLKNTFLSPHSRLTECVLGRTTEDFRSLYDLGRELGRGQFGVTYLCIEKSTGKQFACKSIAKRKLTTPEDVGDVKNEIAIMNLLVGNPNIVELKGAYEDKFAVHLVMELCAGGELFDRITARGHYSERAAAALCRTIITVVQTCHSHGVMHRDLKPENFLFLDPSESAPLKATDFGLSVFCKPGQVFHELVGSPYYVAPEVLYKSYGPEADVWSAGVILYILLSGVPPFWGETEEKIFQEIKRGKLDLDSQPWPWITKEAKDLVHGMLTRDPRKRLTTAQVLQHPWIAKDGVASPKPLDSTVLKRLRGFGAMNKLKKVAFNFIASSLSNEEILGLRELFRSFDKNNTGNISLEELRKGLAQRGCHLSDAESDQLLASADLDQDGAINYTEFVAATLHMSKLQKEDRIYAAFQHFDKDNSGFITADEIAHSLQEHNISVDRAMLYSIIADIDKDFDGRINYDEFAAMMRSTDDGFSPLPAAAARALAPHTLVSPGGRIRYRDLPILSPRPRPSPLAPHDSGLQPMQS
eukprot:TRINITY_DN2815_c0_g1_i1.p1 TRINITY_DN2815_c0_g1~~TRINITY_DN2815_c0_g1_i1.p1  ORF type:complete len:761 (-),score=182.52 TRINITY_DN2815_c0_g1_i1:1178-3460(-)